MQIVMMVAVGLVVGMMAGLVLHRRGFIPSVIIGGVGSFAAALLGLSLGWFRGATGTGSIVFAVCGAIVALAIYGFATARLAGNRR
jgi:uncharacterized membrane protein YeaQ/YmgE (transglycosylase-associated protein family)